MEPKVEYRNHVRSASGSPITRPQQQYYTPVDRVVPAVILPYTLPKRCALSAHIVRGQPAWIHHNK